MQRIQLIFVFTIILAFSHRASALLIVNITEGSGNTATFELIGSGVVPSGVNIDHFNFGSSTDTFLLDGTGGNQDLSVSPSFTLGSAVGGRILVIDGQGGFLGFHSRMTIDFNTSGNFVAGDNLSDLDGVYTTTIPYGIFVPGSYAPDIDDRGLGPYTVNVGAVPSVPEPATAIPLLGLMLGLTWVRRKRMNKA